MLMKFSCESRGQVHDRAYNGASNNNYWDRREVMKFNYEGVGPTKFHSSHILLNGKVLKL